MEKMVIVCQTQLGFMVLKHG